MCDNKDLNLEYLTPAAEKYILAEWYKLQSNFMTFINNIAFRIKYLNLWKSLILNLYSFSIFLMFRQNVFSKLGLLLKKKQIKDDVLVLFVCLFIFSSSKSGVHLHEPRGRVKQFYKQNFIILHREFLLIFFIQ